MCRGGFQTRKLSSESAFHQEMLRIFVSLRDLHTNYTLPNPFSDRTAFLPFLVEEFFENKVRKYMVTQLIGNPGDASFEVGVELLKWNGIPIDRAVELNADRYAGSNFEARHARGVESLTIRPLNSDIPPDEEWVNVTYRSTTGQEKELRFSWMIFELQNDATAMATDSIDSANAGLDIQRDAVRRSTKMLFAPKLIAAQSRAAGRRAVMGAGDLATSLPDIFAARTVTTTNGTFGHLRIRSFSVNNPDAFIAEFIRLIEQLPQEGLIIDVRDTGGGHIFAPTEFCNSIGQRYHGPVVLITNAKCYSATDIFSAGFQDHQIGPILGVDGNTGAGGANVWTHELLRRLDSRPTTPYVTLPSGANMRVAIRRTLRQGAMSGTPVEDLGVRPDVRHFMTRADLLNGNVDLIEAAAKLLAGKPVRRLNANRVGTSLPIKLKVETLNIDQLVVLVDGVAVFSQPITDGTTTITLPNSVSTFTSIDLQGFDANVLVAGRKLK